VVSEKFSHTLGDIQTECPLNLLVVLGSTVILVSEPPGIHDHTSLPDGSASLQVLSLS
jgi:hypothetical protein